MFSIFYIQCFNVIPIKPLKIYSDLSDTNLLKKDLSNLGGVYGLIHVKSSKQYIGSSLNLYSRLMNHIKGKYSNSRLQRSIKTHGLKNFYAVIYYFHTEPAVLLTEIETIVLSAFPVSSLFNFKKKANSMLGYKHTKQAIEKMKSRFLNKTNHSMFGKSHKKLTLSLKSKSGKLNPMFGKSQSENTKNLISIKDSIKPWGLYDKNYKLIEKYSNQVELAKKFSVHNSTISKNIKSGKLFKGKFYLRKINNVNKKQ